MDNLGDNFSNSNATVARTKYNVHISRIYTSTVFTRVQYNPGQNNPGYMCVASTHDILRH